MKYDKAFFKLLLFSAATIFNKIPGVKLKPEACNYTELSSARIEMKTAGNSLTAGHQDSGYLASFVDKMIFSF